ncbi:MAG: glycosyltransferase family 4 protein [Burkholderiaceae bacterium]
MNILFCSVPFHPSIGGTETVSALLADHFHRAGHRVVLVTRSAAAGPERDPFEVVRQPSAARLFALVRDAEVVFHNNISLRFAWPQLLLRRPWVVAHHTWIPRHGIAARLKRAMLGRAVNIAISRAVAQSLPVASTIVPNPYADDVFARDDRAARQGDLVFVGRLTDEKGVDRLVAALRLLAARGKQVGLTIVGDGPEAPALRRQVEAAGLGDRIRFAGWQVAQELVGTLNRHRVLVLPSVCEETFGIVVLEGLACGCVPLVTRSGGLPDAVGDCGVIVARDDPVALADGIEALLGDAGLQESYRARAPDHLRRHTPDRIAKDYLQVLANACIAGAR